MRLVLRLGAALTIAALTLAACTSSPTTAPAAGGGKTASLEIKNFAFAPATLTIDTGTVVTVTNADSTAHTVTSGTNGTKDGKFDQQFEANAKGTLTFNTAGTFAYFCMIHGASMSGTIVVK